MPHNSVGGAVGTKAASEIARAEVQSVDVIQRISAAANLAANRLQADGGQPTNARMSRRFQFSLND